MKGPGAPARLAASIRAVVVLSLGLSVTSGCTPSDDVVSTSDGDLSAQRASDEAALPSVSLPDLSQLAESARDQVSERYAALEQLRGLENPSASAGQLANAYGALGLMLTATDHYAAAATSYLHAKALAPNDMRWPYYLGRLNIRTGELARAAEFLGRAVELQPTDVPALVSLGQVHLDGGRPDAAEPLFAQAVLLEPGSSAALAGLGRAALDSGAYLRATEHLERALALDQQASTLRFPLAMAHRALGNLEAAEAHLQLGGDGEPTLDDPLMQAYDELLQGAVAHERRGLQALNEGRLAEAAGAFREGLALEPDNPALRHRLATALVVGGDTTGAVQELEELLRRAPDFAPAHFSLGSIDYVNGRYDDALDRFSGALRYQPNYLEARIGLAETMRLTGRLEESLPHYRQVVEADPRSVSAWVGGAEALVRLERYPEAEQWLTEARTVHGGRPEFVQLEQTVRAALEPGRQ